MTKQQLINHLTSSGVLASPPLIKAFENIDRADFIPAQSKKIAYEDFPIPIGFGQTNSQPSTVAFMLELLGVQKGDKVLDVGSGSGWTTALLAFLVGATGQVCAVEKIPELVEFAQKNLVKYHFPWIKVQKSDDVLGLPEDGPYNKILVSAAAQELPKELVDQLANGGVMVIPVGNAIFKVTKNDNGDITSEEFPGFSFVPLVG